MSYDPHDIDAQEAETADRKSAEDVALQNEIGDLKKLMGNPHGRRVMFRLLDKAHIFTAAPIADHAAMAFWAGERNYGLRLMALVTENCGEHYLAMLKENQA